MNYKLVLELALHDKRSNYIYSCKIKQYQKKLMGLGGEVRLVSVEVGMESREFEIVSLDNSWF